MTGDILATMAAELDECAELLRPHYPKASKKQLRAIATSMRAERYQTGQWPSDEEIKSRAEKERLEAQAEAKRLAAAKAEAAAS